MAALRTVNDMTCGSRKTGHWVGSTSESIALITEGLDRRALVFTRKQVVCNELEAGFAVGDKAKFLGYTEQGQHISTRKYVTIRENTVHYICDIIAQL